MSPRTVVDLEIAASPERVWRALRDPADIRRWFGWDHEGLDAEIEQIFVTGATVDEDAHTLDTGDGAFTLAPSGAGTQLTITRTAEPAGDPDPVDAGWVTFAQQLRFALERAPGDDRVAERIDAPDPLPDGELWFKDRHHTGIVSADGAELLVVEGDKAVRSRYAGG